MPVKTTCLIVALGLLVAVPSARADGKWEVTPESKAASDRALRWLAERQTQAGNWGTRDLGLVSLGVLAFLSAGHMPGRGEYGQNVQRGLDYILTNAQPTGLLNIADAQRDMYNHGLSTFVLTQAYGMSSDPRLGKTLDKALKLIADVQCRDGGWDYKAVRQDRGHDLSLAVMQAKALRAAMDVGMEIAPRTIDKAIESVRRYYRPSGEPDGRGHLYGTDPIAARPGQFTYDGHRATDACGAAGAVCLQEFGQYKDFRIFRSLDEVLKTVVKDRGKWGVTEGDRRKNRGKANGNQVPMDSAYTLYYLSQALYQVGGERWRTYYPDLRDGLINAQYPATSREAGSWRSGQHSGHGNLMGTAVGVLVLNIPNRYLPILQRGEEAAPAPPETPAQQQDGEE